MSQLRALKAVIAVATMAMLILGSAAPASAATLPTRPFSMWPPNFCAKSAGNGLHQGGNLYYIGAVTASMKAVGPDGQCNDPSPAPAGVFAAMPRLQVYFTPTGGWSRCRYEDRLWVANPHGGWMVASGDTVFGCGAAPHRLWASSRITYGGGNYYDNRYTGAL